MSEYNDSNNYSGSDYGSGYSGGGGYNNYNNSYNNTGSGGYSNGYSDNNGYQNYSGGGQGGSDWNGGNGPKKKRSVGRVMAITLALLVLAGVAAAGGYSVHTLVDHFSSDDDAAEEEVLQETAAQEVREPEETIASNPTISSTQETQGSVVLTDVSDVVAAVMPSLVAVTNTSVYTSSGSGYYGFGFGFFGYGSDDETEYATESSGSGIIIGQNDSELLIVTNNHVVEDNTSLTVQFVDNSTAEAVVKGAKSTADIAIISVSLDDLSSETKSAISIATLGDSDSLRIGQGVIAIGNALGYGQTTTVGVISALNREVTTSEGTTLTALQTSAAINAGNSGGALLNAAGEVIGINTAKVMETGVEGIGYAIPISSVMDLIEEMMNYETRTPVADEDAGYLGIYPWTVDSQSAAMYSMPEGAYVYSVAEGTPAAEYGILAGDIITAVDQYSVTNKTELQDVLAYYAGGETITLTIQRQTGGVYEEIQLDVTLGYKRDYTTE